VKNKQEKIIFFNQHLIVGRSVGGGPMRSRRNIDTSPYHSNNNTYLSPPQESTWRRTSSDSAIHQSLTQAQVRIQFCFQFLEHLTHAIVMNFRIIMFNR
jgi:hypothetical protein